MNLNNDRELECTKEKLRWLEECYEQERQDPGNNPYVQELSLRSLRRTINQFKEEIIRYESRKAAKDRQTALS